jgi:hydrogenase maturation protease
MTMPAGPAVVVGVGNVLLRDDGVGVRVVEELRRRSARDPRIVPETTRLVDGGTLGSGLLDTIHGSRLVMLLDAADLGQAPGTVSVLRGDAIIEAGARDGGTIPGSVGDLLATARLMGWLPDPVAMVAIQVANTGFGVGLSPEVEAAMPDAVATACNELRALDELAQAGPLHTPAVRQEREATA